MILFRIFGWLLVVATLLLLGRDVLAWRDSGIFAPLSLGELWSDLDRAGFDATRSATAVWPWEWAMRHLLALWATLIFAVPGFLLLRHRAAPRPRR